MKFLHTSDWHIGRLFHHASLLDDQRHVLRQIIALATAHQVNAVLIAGDIYDRAIPPVAAVELVDEVFYELTVRLQIPVVLIAGNHDSQQRLGFAARQLADSRLHILGFQTEPEPVVLSDTQGSVAIYGIPYSDPVTIRNIYEVEVHSHDQAMGYLCERIRQHQQQQNYPHSIVLSHCFVGGSTLCDSERPLSVGGSEQVAAEHFANFSYTALGHLHGAQHQLQPTIRYSGSPLKYSFSEASHTKSVTLVTLEADGSCALEALPLQPHHDVRIIEGSLAELLAAGEQAGEQERQDYLLARLTDTTALLDPVPKLRAVYPNLLAMERTGLLRPNRGNAGLASREFRQNELAMFRDFYRHLQDEALSPAQEKLLSELLAETQREEGNERKTECGH